MSWLSSLFTGNSSGLTNAQNSLASTGGFATGLGQQDVNSASNFYNTLLSGNQGAIGKLLAPQISSIQKSGQQQVQMLDQFGGRSGGTAAAAANIGTQTRGSINDMISSLTGNAASNVASLGTNLLNTGINATNSSANIAQLILGNQQKSIFGSGLSSGLGSLEGFGLGIL